MLKEDMRGEYYGKGFLTMALSVIMLAWGAFGMYLFITGG